MEQGLPNLPYEIVFDILSRLPVKSLCRFKSVSKPWLALITDPQFIQSHLHESMKSDVNHKVIIAPQFPSSFESFYSVDYLAPIHTVAEFDIPYKSGVGIWGSFNGVLLFETVDELCLWNPSIRKHQKFSHPICPGYLDVSFWYAGQGTVLNGAPRWLVNRYIERYFDIVCFDVTEEKFKEVPKPINEVEDDLFIWGFWEDGFVWFDNRLVSHSDDVWVMKEYGVKESWTKLFVLPNVPGEFCFRCCVTHRMGSMIIMIDKK